MADFLGNQLQNLLNIKPIDLGQAISPIAQGLQRRGEIQYKQGLIDKQNQTKDAAAQAMAVLKLPPEQRGQALQGLFAQAEMNKDQKAMQFISQVNESDPVTQEAILTKVAALGGFDVNNMNGGAGQNLPSSVRETQWFNQQTPDVQQAHLKLKRGLQLTPQEKLDYERSLADIKAGQKGKEIEAVTDAETKVSDAAAKNEANKAKSVQLAKDAAEAAKSAQGTFKTLKGANRIYDKAISAIDKGAESGAFAKILPTLRSQTLELQNAIREAGLNTISGVTLGAISKPELELALAVDIPEGMDEKDLKPYLQKKKEANIKLMKELNKMSSFLSKKGNTVAMWNEKWGGDTTLEASDKPKAPQAALKFLQDNPGQLENFKTKYGYTPEGF